MYRSSEGKSQAEITSEWQQRENVARLGAWLWNYYVVRDDCYANYSMSGEPFCVRDRANPGEPVFDKGVLILHCQGRKTVGSYTTEPVNHTCIYQTTDIDAHTVEADPEANFRHALSRYGYLRSIGFDPLLTDSNGRGGYHLDIRVAAQ